jgi:N-acyl-L-homoserine lactone synthetase
LKKTDTSRFTSEPNASNKQQDTNNESEYYLNQGLKYAQNNDYSKAILVIIQNTLKTILNDTGCDFQ